MTVTVHYSNFCLSLELQICAIVYIITISYFYISTLLDYVTNIEGK